MKYTGKLYSFLACFGSARRISDNARRQDSTSYRRFRRHERDNPVTEEILWERRGRIGIVTLNRPDQRNALATGNHRRLREIFEEFDLDDELWVAIVTGAGDTAF